MEQDKPNKLGKPKTNTFEQEEEQSVKTCMRINAYMYSYEMHV